MRLTYKIASTIRRREWMGGRPAEGTGTIGAINSHCASVRSDGYSFGLRRCLREPMPHHESPIRFGAEIEQISKHILSSRPTRLRWIECGYMSCPRHAQKETLFSVASVRWRVDVGPDACAERHRSNRPTVGGTTRANRRSAGIE